MDLRTNRVVWDASVILVLCAAVSYSLLTKQLLVENLKRIGAQDMLAIKLKFFGIIIVLAAIIMIGLSKAG